MNALTGLNPAQRDAVIHDAGPLIVLAGPGTGKTRVIVHRVADLIARRDAPPSSILAVTFTIKAADEMRGRLGELLNHSASAQAVRVHTFHALGMNILRRFGDVLGLGTRLTLIDPVQRRRLVKELLQQHELFRSSRASGLSTAAEHATNLFERLANHAVEPADARRRAESWITEAANLTDATQRDGEIARAEIFHDAARLYSLTREACLERAWLSFDDLISMPIRLLREHDRIAAIIRSELRHIVVDEFQDMNPAQIEFLRQLAPRSPTVATDICVVGDDDQAIYGFRGADDRAFEHFHHAFPGARVIRLEENYRSRQRIIGVANATIALASRRFDHAKVIRPGTIANPEAQATPAHRDGRVECVSLTSDSHAGAVIAALIRADQRVAPERRLTSFAVVAKSHLQLERIGAALDMEGIPSRRLRVKGKLDDAGVEIVLAWAAAILDARDWAGIRPLLLAAPIHLPPDAVLTLEHRYLASASRFEAGEPDAILPDEYLAWLLTQPEAPPSLPAINQNILALRAVSAHISASEALRRIVHTSAVANAELLDAKARAMRVSALVTLLRYAADRQERLRPPADLRAFIEEYLEDLRSGGGDDSGALDSSDMVDDHQSPADEPRDEVLLVTAHSAKGLEFDTVFVPGVSPKARWPEARVRDESGIAAPPGLCGSLLTDEQRAADVMDEQRRLFYVACTRARHRLVLLASKTKTRSKGINFFDELTLDAPGSSLVTPIDEADALASGNVAPASPWDLNADLDTRQSRRELIDRWRQRARQEAASALDAVERAPQWADQLAASINILERAAARLAALAAVCRGESGDAIANTLASASRPALATDVAQMVDRLRALGLDKGACETASDNDPVSVQALFSARGLMPMRVRPPLRLSFTTIDAYRRCPMCYFLRYVLGLPEQEREATEIGSIAHAALERFYRQWSTADAEGLARPGKADLLAIGRRLFFQSLAPEGRADKELLDKLMAQLELLHDRLHDENAHVLELERKVTWIFAHAGVNHTIDAKIDRIDRDAAGLRIIDYKTGQAWKKLLAPPPDDLQLGLYAMALDHLYADPPPDNTPSQPAQAGPIRLAGHAEYWILSTGQRGSIALDRLNRAKIDKQIREVIDGILAGDWTPKDDCPGPCALFRNPPDNP